MSLDTFVKKGHIKIDATVRFDVNESEVNIPMSMRLEHVVAVVLYEYAIDRPNRFEPASNVTATTASSATSFTVTGDNQFVVGEGVEFSGFAGALVALNGVQGIISAATATTFTVLSTANPGIAVDAGIATASARGSFSPCLWRIEFPDLITASHIGNIGMGHAIAIDNADVTHVVYDTPRVMSVSNKGRLASLRMRIVSVGDNDFASPGGTAARFVSANFWMSFICKDPTWQQPEQVTRSDAQLPGYHQQPFWGRTNF